MDFRIVIDSREQQPYTFACEVVKAKLDAGDYSVVGFEQRVAVERKSLRDFVGTVIHDLIVSLASFKSYRGWKRRASWSKLI